MIRAYLYALDPTDAQVQGLRSHCGAQRYAYNFGLALVKANLDQRAAERSYGIADDQLTPAVSWSAYSLRRAWNQRSTTWRRGHRPNAAAAGWSASTWASSP